MTNHTNKSFRRSLLPLTLAAAAVLGSARFADAQTFGRGYGDNQVVNQRLSVDDGYAAYEAGRFDEAARIFEQHADDGDFNAQYMLGLIYHTGQGVERDAPRAAGLYDKAAARGHVAAACNLGLLLRDGDGIKPDLEYARTCFRWAALRENTPAQTAFANMLFEGVGGEESQADALAWWQIASVTSDEAKALYEKHAAGLTGESADKVNQQVEAITEAIDEVRRDDIRKRAVNGELTVAWDMGLVLERHAAGWIVTGYNGDGYDFAADGDDFSDDVEDQQASANFQYVSIQDEEPENAFANALPVGTIITAALGHELERASTIDAVKQILSFNELALKVLRPSSDARTGWVEADVTIKRTEHPVVNELGEKVTSRNIWIRNVWIETETPAFAKKQTKLPVMNGVYRQ